MGTRPHLVQPRADQEPTDEAGATFAAYAHRIYQDQRADAQSRQLLLAVAYARILNRAVGTWTGVRAALGVAVGGSVSLDELIRHDLPRYEPPGTRWGDDPLDRCCSGPRLRPHPGGDDDFRNRLRVCGADAQECVVEKLPGTGWHKNHWFCPRHRDHLARVREQVEEHNLLAPEPVPNRGGLLPSYFVADWLRIYRGVTTPSWQAPAYGLSADGWPVPGQEQDPRHPRLRLVLLSD